jgi:hypothetical protein
MTLYCEACGLAAAWAGTCEIGNEPRHEVCHQQMKTVLAPEELVARGGNFYSIGIEAWCDTKFDSWKLVKGVGYVRQ